VSRAVFIDTAAWYAFIDVDDADHLRSDRCFRRLTRQGQPLATSNHVVSETYTLCRRRLGARLAREFLRRLHISGATQRIFVQEAWEQEAEALLVQYEDQDFSYVDATSFVVMRRTGLREAFIFDHHFQILGFNVIGPDE
jgi:uncharacterized protein